VDCILNQGGGGKGVKKNKVKQQKGQNAHEKQRTKKGYNSREGGGKKKNSQDVKEVKKTWKWASVEGLAREGKAGKTRNARRKSVQQAKNGGRTE